MPPHEAEVLSALKLLYDAPSELLHLHRELAVRTWRQVGRNLNTTRSEIDVTNSHEMEGADPPLVGITGPRLSSIRGEISAGATDMINQGVGKSRQICLPGNADRCGPVGIPPTSSEHIHKRQRKRRRIEDDPATRLLQRVQQRLPEVQKFSKRKATLSGILQNEQQIQFADKRVDHLKQIDGNKTPSEEQKLLRGLSQISLARQFTDWELERGWKSKASLQYDAIHNNSKNMKSRGKISRFIRDNEYPRSDENVVAKGIQRGITQVVFSKLLHDVLKNTEHEHNIQGIVVLITVFEYSLFQSLTISELPVLINLLLEERNEKSAIATPMGKSFSKSVIASVGDISKWFQDMCCDFELISRKATREKEPDQVGMNQQQPDVATRQLDLDFSSRHYAHQSEFNEDRCQPSRPVATNIGSHELTSFSTLFPDDLNDPGEPPNPSALESRQNQSEVRTALDTSHDLAQFSRYSNNVTGDLAGDSISYSILQGLNLIPRVSNDLADDISMFPALSHPAFEKNVHKPPSSFQSGSNSTPHDISSFSTFLLGQDSNFTCF
ncbi:hypothetical protein HAV15_001190 [Penicillium sp. str. |nr:hypothetical protein HAV15_001190 [Penicillium sp. str. \